MHTYEYNNGLLHGDRRPRLYLAKGAEVVKFFGESIPGFCLVLTTKYQANGKWSNTTYEIQLVSGVRPLRFASPLHGVWGEQFGSWGEVAEELALPVGTVQTLVREEYKTTASRLDEIERFALELEERDVTMEIVVISFGSPTNRQIQQGYWKNVKSSQTCNGRVVTVKPHPESGWSNPIVVEPEGAKVISSKNSPGMHGGYWSIEVAVPE